MAEKYAHPEVLVETGWLSEHLKDPAIRVVEVSEDVTLYGQGHIPGAVHFNWKSHLQDPVRRDWISLQEFETLLGGHGVGPGTTLVLYGDKNNWFATYTFWLSKLYGVERVTILNGGRGKWIAEGRPMTTEVPAYPKVTFRARAADPNIRAFRDQVLERLGKPQVALVDVRSPQEYSGELIAMPAYPQEGAQRGGHIPTAQSIPWVQNVREDGTFKAPEELRALYQGKGITPDKEVIAYCRIGERSSHTWFTLKYLLGYPTVRNYDGSWTEWGSLVGVPIENPSAAEATRR
ncbi:MAG TPA: sulfurtransferase [bacterium]|nr:sulfurtransferase [bacterium]